MSKKPFAAGQYDCWLKIGPSQIQWSKRKSGFGPPLEAIYFRDAEGGVRLVRVFGEPKPENIAKLPFKVKLAVRTEEEFTEMFDQSWRYLAENFYDSKFSGSDWDAVRGKYRPLVKHVTMKEDLYALLYLMMGELNASHLGVVSQDLKPPGPSGNPQPISPIIDSVQDSREEAG